MKWIISNHKNLLLTEEIPSYLGKLSSLELENINLVVCPASNHLGFFKNQKYVLGSQDIIENTVEELNMYSVKYTIVGHSDIRKKYNETNEIINKKIKKLLNANICPILCIGEENNSDIKETLKQELNGALNDINEKIIIAYEPVWAINSGKIPEIDKLKEIIDYINKEATNLIGIKPIILYGGSVNENTINDLKQVESLDGYLIGNASLDVNNIKRVIEIINEEGK